MEWIDIHIHFFHNRFIEILFTYHSISQLKQCNSVVFSIAIELCSHHHSPFQNILIIPPKKTRTIANQACSPRPPTSDLRSFVMDMTVLGISCKFHIQSFCDWLSLSVTFSTFIHIVPSISTSFLSNSIPLYGYTAFYLFIYHLIDYFLFHQKLME